jgi:Concanavalin A-like lectin/glucanases superfamily
MSPRLLRPRQAADLVAASLLLPFETGTADASPSAVAVTSVGVSVTSAQSKVGSSSAYFDGSSYLTVPFSSLFDFVGSDWTVECWLRFGDLSGEQAIVELYNSNLDTGFVIIKISDTNQSDGNKPFFYAGSVGAVYPVTSDTFAIDDWQHLAVCSKAGVTTIFLNGVNVASGEVAVVNNPQDWVLSIGARYSASGGSNFLRGYIDDLRIVRGVCVYGDDFSPPLSPLPPAVKRKS